LSIHFGKFSGIAAEITDNQMDNGISEQAAHDQTHQEKQHPPQPGLI
jgi:hypothetical protein